ncbi:MAG: hydrogenase maturation protease [Candidatus Bathyarchaeia archaeon]
MGNKLLGDDGFGPTVIELLSSTELPENVELRDFGTAGITVATELYDYGMAIFVDTMKKGGKPGTLHRMEVNVGNVDVKELTSLARFSLHEVRLEGLLTFAKAIGALPPRVILIGCEPMTLDPSLDLSREVRKATKKAVDLILNELGLRKA